MGATSTSKERIESFIASVKRDYPQFKFEAGAQDHWSPGSNTVTYNPARNLRELQYGLLHELSHALLGHSNYSSDFELLRLESEAWHKAAMLAKKYGINIDDDHIQDCLDTYRDWLHRRSTCPSCGMHVLQKDTKKYHCFNCQTEWSVSGSRFVRAYRRSFKESA